MPYQSAAEKRRQRAAETADSWDAPTLMDGFGRGERTGLGGRAAVADSVTRATAVAPPTHSYRVGGASDSGDPAYLYHSPPNAGGGALSSARRSVLPQPSPHNIPPMPHVPPAGAAAGAFDPNLFGDNSSRAMGAASYGHAGGQPLRAGQLPQLDPRALGGAYAAPTSGNAPPHPLEYDGGVPPAAAAPRFGASSRALNEYYNRTSGPILDDGDRAAIEDFFATDDFTDQFNARAAAMRAAAHHPAALLPPMPHAPPPTYPASSVTGRHLRPEEDPRYPLCHRCHQAIIAAELQARKDAAKKPLSKKAPAALSRKVPGSTRLRAL